VKMSALFIVHSKRRNTGSLLYKPRTFFFFFSLHEPFCVTGFNISLYAVEICRESGSTCLNQCVAFDIRILLIIFKEALESFIALDCR
jgi:hypothetical protein